jgi:hypothetical protein
MVVQSRRGGLMEKRGLNGEEAAQWRRGGSMLAAAVWLLFTPWQNSINP